MILRSLNLIILAATLLLAGGCTTTITPPPNPKEPVQVFLTDQWIHSSVLLPTDDGRYVEYAFGDWNYAALNHTWPHDAIGALFFSGQGALGRRYFEIHLDKDPPAAELKGIKLNPFYVDRDDVKKLIIDLDAYYKTGTEPRHNDENNFVFVRIDDHYSLFHNCNSRTKQYLRQLKCDVHSYSVFAMYNVHQSPVPVLPQHGVVAAAKPPEPTTRMSENPAQPTTQMSEKSAEPTTRLSQTPAVPQTASDLR